MQAFHCTVQRISDGIPAARTSFPSTPRTDVRCLAASSHINFSTLHALVTQFICTQVGHAQVLDQAQLRRFLATSREVLTLEISPQLSRTYIATALQPKHKLVPYWTSTVLEIRLEICSKSGLLYFDSVVSISF